MSGHTHADELLLEELREMWGEIDPAPHDLADRMVAAVAVDDVSRELELLTLTEEADLAPVRAGVASRTLRFEDEASTVLLHIAPTSVGCRIDGWSDPPVVDEHATDATVDGRFSFADVPRGASSVRMAVRATDGIRAVTTPRFDA